MLALSKGRYRARIAQGADDLTAAQQLRAMAFGTGAERDEDDFDAICTHILTEEERDGRLVCCFRFLPLTGGAEIGRCYAAQFYDLGALADFDRPISTIGPSKSARAPRS